MFGQMFDQVFDQMFGHGFDQGWGKGKNHKYSVQYYPAEGKHLKNNKKSIKSSKTSNLPLSKSFSKPCLKELNPLSTL